MPESLKQPELEVVAYIEHHKGGDNLEWEHPGGKHTPLTSLPAALSIIESLRSQLQEAERDAVRLQWMSTHEAWIGWNREGDLCRVYRTGCNEEDPREGPVCGWKAFFDDHRAAIDAAIAASSQGGGNG